MFLCSVCAMSDHAEIFAHVIAVVFICVCACKYTHQYIHEVFDISSNLIVFTKKHAANFLSFFNSGFEKSLAFSIFNI